MIVNLISGPRNISTALMYSFAQRQDCVVLDEPFYAYYLDQTGADHPGRDKVLQSLPVDADKVIERIARLGAQHDLVFVKNMAHHILWDDLSAVRHWKNVFLIRDPWELIISFAKVIPNPAIEDIGLKRAASLYQMLGDESVVVDSNEILKSPPTVLAAVCRQLGVETDDNMLQWSAGARKEDGVWAKYWYANVHQSTGFGPPRTMREEMPPHLMPLYQEARKYYDILSANSIKYATTI
ncbi:MAG: sulfotransferase family protein [Bacteroidota bacterium]